MENDDKRNHYLGYAHELLLYFIKQCKHFYGELFTVYNVHSLAHLCSDSQKFQCSLNKISCFKFENYLQTLKKMIRNAKNPIAQVAKRLSEMEESECKSGRGDGQREMRISTSSKDRCFLLNDGFVFVKEIRANNTYLCDVLTQTDSFLLNLVIQNC